MSRTQRPTEAPPRILIVDDEEHIRETMQLAMEAVGYEAQTASDGAEGLEQFGTGEAWDLVLLDQRMPGMEGLEVLRQMRERDPSARIMMVTAYGTIELAVDAMKAGAVDFLRKPFTPEVFRGAVKTALSLPRQAASEGDHSLTRLLPVAPEGVPLQSEPLIQYRTLNGYRLWEVPLPEGDEESESLRIRRAFEVRAPAGDIHPCVVEITTSVRGLVQEETRHEYLPGDHVWDVIARSALSNYLWEKAELPPASLPVYSLNREQLFTVRSMAGLAPCFWR